MDDLFLLSERQMGKRCSVYTFNLEVGSASLIS